MGLWGYEWPLLQPIKRLVPTHWGPGTSSFSVSYSGATVGGVLQGGQMDLK